MFQFICFFTLGTECRLKTLVKGADGLEGYISHGSTEVG